VHEQYPLRERMETPCKNIFYGWWVVLTAAIGLLFGYAPIFVFSFGIFVKSFVRDFHLSRTQISLAFTLASLMVSVGSPIAGRLVDRWGARPVILPSIGILGTLVIAFKFISASAWQLYALFLLLGLVGSVTNPVTYCKVVSNWFDRRRGLALGLTMLGLGLGAIIMPPTAQRLIALFGWRSAYAILGGTVLIVSIPIVGLFLKNTPQEIGLLPDGDADRHDERSPATLESGIAGPLARRSGAFWLIAGAFSLAGGAAQACVIHLVPMLSDRGISAEKAALASSALGIAYVAGRVVAGYLADRFFAPYVAVFLFAGMVLGLGLLMTGSSGWFAFVGASLVGLGMGGEGDLMPYITGRYFGLRFFGEIYGSLFAVFTLTGAVAPFLMAVGFDRTGSYRIPLLFLIVATLISLILITRLGPYRFRSRNEEASPQILVERD
jgi:MFS family permease